MCVCVCVCVGIGVGLTFYLNFLGLCVYIYTCCLHLSLSIVPVGRSSLQPSSNPFTSHLPFGATPHHPMCLCSCLSREVRWCVSEQALYLPQLRTLSSGICTLELIHLTTRTPLPSKSFATVGQECLLEVYTWGTFVKHAAPLSSMGHLCQAWGTFVKHGAPLSSMGHLCQAWGTFVKHGAPLSSMGHLCQAWGTFVKHGAPLSSMGHLCQAWGTFVKHGAPLSSMGHLCQAWGTFALLY